MRTSTNNLMVILILSAAVMAANTALAGGFSFGGGNAGGGGGGGSGFKVSFGGGNHNNHNNHNNNHNHHGHHHHKFHKYYHYPVKKYYAPTYVVYDQCYHPYYSYCYVYPGDTWYTISKRCYGHSHLWKHIATYNSLGLSSSALVPGQQIQLPVVNANGTLAASNAPAPAQFAAQGTSFAPQGAPLGPQTQSIMPQGLPNGLGSGSPLPQSEATTPITGAQQLGSTAPAAPVASIRTISDEPKRPVVTPGSTILLEGQSLGSAKGIVRLRISGMAMPVEVLEWSDSSVRVKLPTMDMVERVPADLEVLRADGSLASKSAIELTPAATRLALGN